MQVSDFQFTNPQLIKLDYNLNPNFEADGII